jgi:hypothetical protein
LSNLFQFYYYYFNHRRTNVESEDIVAELVHGFLIPEAQKQVYREQRIFIYPYNQTYRFIERYFFNFFFFLSLVKMKQEPYLMAAHKEIYNETNKVLSNEND